MDRDIVVPETGHVVRARRVSLPVEGHAPVALWVDRQEKDEISAALLAGTYDAPAHYRLADELLTPVSRVLDLGAHVGTFALRYAAAGCEVAAVEASPTNAALLRASAESNGFGRLHVRWAAAARAAGELRFRVAGPYGLVAPHDPRAIVVPAVAPSAVLTALGWPRADFVKLDVEGFEVDALRGLAAHLDGDDAPVVSYESNGHTLHLQGESPRSLAALLDRSGYRCYEVGAQDLTLLDPLLRQARCNVDCLATKRPDRLPARWQRRPPIAPAEQRARTLAAARHSHPHVRTYAARSLAADDAVTDLETACALDRLLDDAEPSVRRAARWWDAPDRDV